MQTKPKCSVRACVMIGLLVVALLAVVGPAVHAQTIYGSINGTVFDQTRAAIPGVEVVVRNIDTGLTRETVTNERGFYRVPALPTGSYSVRAMMPGFEETVVEPVGVNSSIEYTVDFVLRTRGIEETITITSVTPLIDTTKSQISKFADNRQIMELPGQNTLTGLALLMPGTTPNNNNRPGSGFAVNGGRTRSNNFTIDGANNNDQSLSIPRQQVPQDAIQEFVLVTNNFSAEYGRNSGSFVNVITRSGSNRISGAATWFWQGNGLNALTTGQTRTFNAQKAAGLDDKAALRRARGVNVNNVGAVSVGGPIKRDHTFFFTSYDKAWYRSTAVPTPAVAISQAGWDNLQAAGGQFAPGALAFLQRTYPLANDPTSRGTVTVSTPDGPVPVPMQQYNRALGTVIPYARDYYRWMQKIDTRWGDKDSFSFRYLIDDDANPGFPASLPVNDLGQAIRNQSFTINQTHLFGPGTVNESRVTYARRSANFLENFPTQFNISGSGLPFVGNQNFPQYRTDNMYEFTNNLSHIMGRHTLKMGANVLRYQLNSFFAPATKGVASYPSLTDFLFDRNATWQQYAGDGYTPARTTELGMFFQDDFKLRPSFTINMGIRYEYTGAPFGYFSEAKPDINNFAPRLGFAWRPNYSEGLMGLIFGNGDGVIRGGYAISYDQVFQNILLNNSRNFPRGVNVSFSGLTGQQIYETPPPPPTPEDYVAQGNNPDLLPVRLYSPNKRIGQPYGQQFSLGIDRQIGPDWVTRVYYIGSRGVKLVREVERNLGFFLSAVNANPSVYGSVVNDLKPITVSGQPALRTDPTKGSILIGDGLAQSAYHSLQLSLEKRFSRGLQFQANYTWSTYISDSDDILGGQANATLPANPIDLRLDRGRSAFDTPHRFVLNYIYEVPTILEDSPVLSRIFSGWQVAGITTWQTGSPFSILNANNAMGILPGAIATVAFSQRASVNPQGTYPLPTAAGVGSPYYLANPANSGIVGDAGRNIERVGNTALFDMNIGRRIRTFGENQSLQLRFEFLNIMNHRNFTVNPSNTVSNATNTALFMNLGQTNVGGRTVSMGMRYMF